MKKVDNSFASKSFWLSISFLVLAVVFGIYQETYYLSFVALYSIAVFSYIRRISLKWNDTMSKVSSFTFIVLFLSPAFVYLMINIIDNFVHLYPGILVVQGSKSDWISFSGSIIGGAMTLFAVVFTLQNERDNRRREKALSILPLLKCHFEQSTNYESASLMNLDKFSISNFSDNHAKNIKIIETTVSWLKPREPFSEEYVMIQNEDQSITQKELYISVLPRNENQTFKLRIKEPTDIVDIKRLRNHGYECVINVEFEYEDILGYNKYKHVYKLILEQKSRIHDVSIDNHQIPKYYFYNETNEFSIKEE